MLTEIRTYLRKILDIDKTWPGVCTEAALAQAQFLLSQILTARASKMRSGTETPNQKKNAKSSALLEEAAHLSQLARKALTKPNPLGPLKTATIGQSPEQQIGLTVPFNLEATGIPPEHELALYDHLQPVFDGRYTGLHILQYLRGSGLP